MQKWAPTATFGFSTVRPVQGLMVAVGMELGGLARLTDKFGMQRGQRAVKALS